MWCRLTAGRERRTGGRRHAMTGRGGVRGRERRGGFVGKRVPIREEGRPRPEGSTPPGEDASPVSTSSAPSSEPSGEPVAPARKPRRWPGWVVGAGSAGGGRGARRALATVGARARPGHAAARGRRVLGGRSARLESMATAGNPGSDRAGPGRLAGIFLGAPGAPREAAIPAQREPESVVGLFVAERPLLNARSRRAGRADPGVPARQH